MGNHRFKLSNMMPNAWFYKLRDMSKPKPQNTRKLPQRKSYYHPTESSLIRNHDSSTTLDPQLPCAEPHRKSSKTRAKRKTIYMPSPKQVTPDCIFHDPDENDSNIHLDFQARPDEDIFIDGSEFDSFDEGTSDHHRPIISKGMLRSKFGPSAADDIIIDVNAFAEKLDMASEPGPDMPTKKNNYRPSWSPGRARPGPKKKGVAARKSVSRVKIHGNRLGRRMTAGSKKMESDDDRKIGRKGWLVESESCAVVKASVDPERDFRESMVEMIVENNIRASKDLEELLACYLSLNSNQYHGLIIKAFEQIWFNMPQTHF